MMPLTDCRQPPYGAALVQGGWGELPLWCTLAGPVPPRRPERTRTAPTLPKRARKNKSKTKRHGRPRRTRHARRKTPRTRINSGHRENSGKYCARIPPDARRATRPTLSTPGFPPPRLPAHRTRMNTGRERRVSRRSNPAEAIDSKAKRMLRAQFQSRRNERAGRKQRRRGCTSDARTSKEPQGSEHRTCRPDAHFFQLPAKHRAGRKASHSNESRHKVSPANGWTLSRWPHRRPSATKTDQASGARGVTLHEPTNHDPRSCMKADGEIFGPRRAQANARRMGRKFQAPLT